ncbi:drug:proton antiporter [Legionella quinlivanii]|uniref:Drug:proton antiporter n=1 Tax=Legionella quinlivanii TaxID=45073 RepID=A0A0W0XYU4_9GAMM|nr:MFS transporter [Legionella quinlivanii]KTD49981.1 drug:proton antiporter [Legionella quinlivanii]MCW8450576.1 MFS transporter [Legionella quinlivanii]SEF95742.1 Predicted arabinose efflux permease, MFS family [Legionella quinlivanii DSM 21216]STY11243.1 drug:proton antiporter [Legionella quinlivanii]
MFSNQYRVLRDAKFRRFTLSCMLAMFGNGLTYIIMVWALMRFDTSVVSTSILMACFWLPNVLLGPFFGVLADRWNRKTLLLIANGSRAMVLFGFAYLANDHMTSVSIYILAALIGTLLAAYIPVAMSFVRELVKEEELLAGNAMVDIAYELGAVAGMGGAGFILASASFAGCFAINAVCYVIATLLLLGIPFVKKSNEEKKEISFFRQFIEGGRYILARRTLLLLYLTQGLFFVSYMTAPVLLAPYAKTVLNSNVTQFGWLEAMLSLGIILGGFFNPWLASMFSMFKVIVAEILAGVVGFYLFSHTSNIHLAIFYHFLIGLSFSSWALLTTLAQEMTALDFQGRVQSLFNSVSGVVIVLFYYLLAKWKDIPVQKLYSGEIVLLLIALILLGIAILRKTSNDNELDLNEDELSFE